MKWYFKTPLYMMIFLAMCAASTYLAFQLLSKGLTVEVPDFSKRSLGEVELMVSEMGLKLEVLAEEYDRKIPSGFIISQDVEIGTHLRGEATVGIVLSKGPEVRLIPSAIGESLEEAKRIFLEKELHLGDVIYTHSSTIEKGIVVAQNPAPEEWAGQDIFLIVSQGPQDIAYYSPFFVGMMKEDALLIAADLGLSVKIRELSGSGTVTRQSPKPGEEIKRGQTFKITIGGG